jgi:hypothetical protein
LAVVNVPYPDLNPLHERASVSVKKPVSLVVQDKVECVKVSLAMWAGLDLSFFAFYFVSAFRVAKKSNIAHNLTDLYKLDCAVNRYFGVWVVNVFTLY